MRIVGRSALAGLGILIFAGFPLHGNVQETISESASIPVAKYWLRMYPVQPYSEYWHVSVEVKDLGKTISQAVSLLEKNGGQITLPLENFAASHIHKYQQFSYKISLASAQKALKGLSKLGTIDSLVKNPAINPGVMQEVKNKLTVLQKESMENQAALARMPSVSTLVVELTDHLTQIGAVHEQSRDKILLNVELHEPNPTPKAPPH